MKRTFDIVVSSVGLVLTSPVLLVAAIVVKLESDGPAFYKGDRVGRGGRPFRILKLRTMRWETESQGPSVTAGDDPRITRVGRFLRRTKGDEIPQLFNVLKGDMSLVGPRPEHPKYVALYTPNQRRVLEVRPGMTGPTAIAFFDEEDMLRGGDAESTYVSTVMPQKLAMDLKYVESATQADDLRILGRTVLAVLVRPWSSRRRRP